MSTEVVALTASLRREVSDRLNSDLSEEQIWSLVDELSSPPFSGTILEPAKLVQSRDVAAEDFLEAAKMVQGHYGGIEDTDDRFPAVIGVKREPFPGLKQVVASAVLVHESVSLTAQHVVERHALIGLAQDPILVEEGSDLAILIHDAPQSASPHPIAEANLIVSKKPYYSVGWGRLQRAPQAKNKRNYLPMMFAKKEGTHTIIATASQGTLCYGDSGGGLLVEDQGELKLAGISRKTRDPGCKGAAFYALVDDYRALINDKLEDAGSKISI